MRAEPIKSSILSISTMLKYRGWLVDLVSMKKTTDVEKRLEIMDRELHSMLARIRTGKRGSLKELKKK